MELHVLKERYDAVMTLRKEGLTNEKIGKKLGLSRCAAQRMVWLSQLPAYIRNSYLSGEFADGRVFKLWQLRDDPESIGLAFQAIGTYRHRKVKRTLGEVQRALSHMTNPDVIRTLLWMIGETPTLPV